MASDDQRATETGDAAAQWAELKAAVQFSQEDVDLLKQLRPYTRRWIGTAVDEMYNHLLQFQTVQSFFPDSETLARVKRAQADYFLQLTSGDYGLAYLASRELIGQLHQQIGVPPWWYLAACRVYLDGCLRHILEAFAAEPGKALQAHSALSRLLTLDQMVTIRAYAQAEMAQLHELGATYRRLVDDAVVGVYQTTTDGRFLMANLAFAQMLGYPSADELMESVTDIAVDLYLDPDRREEFQQLLHEQAEVHGFEAEFRRKDGVAVWVSLNARTVRDTNDQVVHYEGIAVDVTDSKRTTESLAQSERRLQEQIRRLGALRTVDMAIAGSMDVRVTLGVLLDQVLAQLEVDAAAIFYWEPGAQEFRFGLGRGSIPPAVEHSASGIGEGKRSQSASERHTVLVANLAVEPDTSPLTKALHGEQFSGYGVTPLIAKGALRGVLEVYTHAPLHPSTDWVSYLEALAGQAAIAIDSTKLFEDLQHQNTELALAYDATLEGWAGALELRDQATEGHTRRATELTAKIARAMGIADEELINIRRGALLHDIGKMAIPDDILRKPGALTEEETEVMQRHPELVVQFIRAIPYLRHAIDIPYCHHEKWDGTGYPRKLKGQDIPIGARIFALVDIWDAVRSDRVYRTAWPQAQAREYIRSLAGTHLDPLVVDTFFSVIDD